MDDFRSRLQEYIRQQARPVEKYGHQPRLYALTRQVGAGMDYDDDVVFAASWLHDLGVFAGHRPEEPEALARWDHIAYTIAKAPSILQECGFPSAKTPAVLEAIRTHQPDADPATIEGTILRDADILEQLGAIGIARTICKIGRDTRFGDFTAATTFLRSALTHLPSQLRLESARSLAHTRTAILEAFIRAIDAEAGGSLH